MALVQSWLLHARWLCTSARLAASPGKKTHSAARSGLSLLSSRFQASALAPFRSLPPTAARVCTAPGHTRSGAFPQEAVWAGLARRFLCDVPAALKPQIPLLGPSLISQQSSKLRTKFRSAKSMREGGAMLIRLEPQTRSPTPLVVGAALPPLPGCPPHLGELGPQRAWSCVFQHSHHSYHNPEEFGWPHSACLLWARGGGGNGRTCAPRRWYKLKT